LDEAPVDLQFCGAGGWARFRLHPNYYPQRPKALAGAQAIVALPKLKVGDYELYQLPLYINEQDPTGGAVAENIGSNIILKRFNLALDFRA
jgi:hypothetical protein